VQLPVLAVLALERDGANVLNVHLRRVPNRTDPHTSLSRLAKRSWRPVMVSRAAIEVPAVDRLLVDGGVEDDLGMQVVKLEDMAMRSSLVPAQIDDTVRQEQAHVHVSLRDVGCAAIPVRLGAVLRPVLGAVAVVAGVVTVRPAIAADITSFVPASATGVACACIAISLGLVLPASSGTPPPLLAIHG